MILWDHDFPASGVFYRDKDLTHELFRGMLVLDHDKPQVIILEKPSDNFGWHNYSEIYAKMNSPQHGEEYNNYTFFNCQKKTVLSKDFDTIKSKDILEFETFVKVEDHRIDDNKKKFGFVSNETSFDRMTLKIDNFNKWLYPGRSRLFKEKSDKVKWLDKHNNECKSVKDSDGFYCFNDEIKKIEIPIRAIHKTMKVLSGLQIEIHSTPMIPLLVDYHYGIDIQQNSKIEIVPNTPKPLGYFYYIIYCLLEFFTAIGDDKCRVSQMYSSKYLEYNVSFYSNIIPWSTKSSKWDSWNDQYGKTNYEDINEILEKTLRSFIRKRHYIINLIQYVSDMDNVYENEHLETQLSHQVQILETYGNMISKGVNKKNNRADLNKAINSMPNDVFQKIFITGRNNWNDIGLKIFDFDGGIENISQKKVSDKEIVKLKERLSEILSELRNFITHPFESGKPKKLTMIEKIPQSYKKSESQLNMQKVNMLSHRLDFALKWLLYKEIGLKNNFTF